MSDSANMITLWRGRPLSELTREELEGALIEMGEAYTREIGKSCPICDIRLGRHHDHEST